MSRHATFTLHNRRDYICNRNARILVPAKRPVAAHRQLKVVCGAMPYIPAQQIIVDKSNEIERCLDDVEHASEWLKWMSSPSFLG